VVAEIHRIARAIFGRRTTQRMIDEAAAVISRRQIRKLVDDLNAMPETPLNPDWELFLLNAFSKIGSSITLSLSTSLDDSFPWWLTRCEFHY